MPQTKRTRAKKATQSAPSIPEPEPDVTKWIGYARVSMSDQNNQRQIDDLLRFGVKQEDIYTDTASGRTMKRPGWQACRKDLREGDLLVIHAIDRLGRDLIEVVQALNELHEKGANIKVLSMDLDTRTPTGRMIFHIIAAMAQWERELIVERTRHGLERARERGNKGGRPRAIEDADVRKAMRRINNGEDASKVAAEFNVSRQTLYKRDRQMRLARAAKRGKAAAVRVMRVTQDVLDTESAVTTSLTERTI